MKIRQIHFRNINSFYGEHKPIQFTDGLLASTGLFVISGPTGAGKSTLLDVITLALFNRIPRLTGALSNNAITQEGLIVNQHALQEPNTFAFAEVEYEVAGGVYRSRWSIKKNRNGNWNNYEMEVAHLREGTTTGTLFPIKNLNEFPKKNEELIGLTYEQFIRSIVLAQGAFDHFLKAKAADRSKMLEKITGTEIYRQLSQRAFEVSKQLTEQLAEKQQAISLIRVSPDDETQALVEQQKRSEIERKELAQRISVLSTEQQLLTTMADAEKALAGLRTRQQVAADRAARFAADAIRLKAHAKVADLTADLTKLEGLERQQHDLLNQRAELSRNQQSLEAGMRTLLAEAGTLTQQPGLTSATLEQAVITFREQVLTLERDEQAAWEAAKQPLARVQQANRSMSDVGLTPLDLRNPETALLATRQLQSTVAHALAALSADYPAITPQTLQHELDQQVNRITAYGQLVSLLKEQQTRLSEGMEMKTKAEGIEADVTLSKAALSQLEQELSQLEQTKIDLEQTWRRLEAETDLNELRAGLRTDEPCPLCGSLQHPYVHHYVQQTGEIALKLRLATADWETKRLERDRANQAWLKAQSNLTTFTEHRQKLRADFMRYKSDLNQRLAEVSLPADSQPMEVEQAIRLFTMHRGQLSRLRELWQQRDLLQRLAADLEQLQQDTLRASKLNAERLMLYSGNTIREHCSQLQNRFTTSQQQQATQRTLLEKAIREQADCQQALDELLKRLTPLLHERGLPDASSASALILESAEARRLQDMQQSLQKETDDIVRRIHEETERYEEARRKRTETDSPDVVSVQLEEAISQQRSIDERVGYVKKQIEHNQEEQKRQYKLVKELSLLEQDAAPWRELSRLIGSARGDEFSKFAQGLTLAQLIGLANRRLRDLTDRYLLLKPRDGQDELFVVDQYQGNAERSVASLSGGETFTLSLSLALGLSDLASQNVQINSLFIDEGFGTLDPETLDTAIVMLEKLQQDSQKTIGIISHRHEIKERISVQIQVEKGNDGNSRLKIAELV